MIKLKQLLTEVGIEKIDYPLVKQNNGTYKAGKFDWHNFVLGKFYNDGDIQRYIYSQHSGFEDDDRINGVYQYLELNPNSIPESEWDINDDKVEMLSKSTKEFPPIVINNDNQIVDGGHRLAASKIRGDKTIKTFKQI